MSIGKFEGSTKVEPHRKGSECFPRMTEKPRISRPGALDGLSSYCVDWPCRGGGADPSQESGGAFHRPYSRAPAADPYSGLPDCRPPPGTPTPDPQPGHPLQTSPPRTPTADLHPGPPLPTPDSGRTYVPGPSRSRRRAMSFLAMVRVPLTAWTGRGGVGGALASVGLALDTKYRVPKAGNSNIFPAEVVVDQLWRTIPQRRGGQSQGSGPGPSTLLPYKRLVPQTSRTAPQTRLASQEGERSLRFREAHEQDRDL